MKKAALYGRVSSEKQENEGTIDSQVAALEEAITTNGDVLVDRYLDNGYSGTLLSRPELDRLRDDAAAGAIEVAYIHSPDRLARRYVYQEIVLEELRNKGVEVIFLNQRIAETPEDNLLLGVQGIIAEYERAKFMERTRRGKLHRVKSGHIVGNIPPYGLSCVKKSESATGFAHYLINEVEASTVRLIFSFLVDHHMSEYRIVLELNKRGIKPRKGDKWAKSTIARILRNSTYAGVTYYNKNYSTQPINKSLKPEQRYSRRKNTSTRLRAKDQWIAIEGIPIVVSQDVFDRAQRQLEDNARFSERNTKQNYLIKGLVRCGTDGRAYYGVPMHGNPFYRCSGKNKLVTTETCGNPSISASVIESLVWEMVVNLVDNPKLIFDQYKQHVASKRQNSSSIDQRIAQLDVVASKIKLEEDRMLAAFSQGIITIDQLSTTNLNIKARKKQVDEDRKVLIESKSSVSAGKLEKKSVNFYLRNVRKMLGKFQFEDKQKFLRLLLDEIILNTNSVMIRGAIPVLAGNDLLRPQSVNGRAARKWQDAVSKSVLRHLTDHV